MVNEEGVIPQPLVGRSDPPRFRQPLEEITDVEFLRKEVENLYQTIDDISTIGDIAKGNDKVFRNLVEGTLKKRSRNITSDGYSLFKNNFEKCSEEPQVANKDVMAHIAS